MNNDENIIIIGGVAAGAAAATRLRRLNEKANITIYEKSTYVSFANCGMPYYIGGEITNRQRILLNTPEFFKERFNIDVIVNHEVVNIDKNEKTITVNDLTKRGLRKKDITVPYDKLLIATGAKHIVPDIEGVDATNIFPLKQISHMDKLKEHIEIWRPEEGIIIGAGFIGIELAEQLKRLGINITIIEKTDQILPHLDPEIAAIVEDHLVSNGIKVIKNDRAQTIIKEGEEERAKKIILESGKEIDSDLILLCIGVRPDVALAVDAGIELGETGAILVNEKMHTNVPDILAAGDVVESTHKVTNAKVWIPLAGPASFQGRVAGTVLAGKDAKFAGVLGSAIVRINKLTVATTGLTERAARKAKLDYVVSYSHSFNHANYYPGATMQHIKLVIEKKTERLLGAQIAGGDGVDKSIDIIAAAINANQSVDDLVDMDLAYAPPFSSVRSPVQMAGMVAQNRMNNIDSCINADEVIDKDYTVIDVRTSAEHDKFKIFEGSELIPIDSLRDNLAKVKKTGKVALLCQAGLRSYLAYRILTQNGYKNVKNINGGYLMSKHILAVKSDGKK
ncbi:FAD-dependent oxidoreductase [Thermodesulfobacteriota bacterium]